MASRKLETRLSRAANDNKPLRLINKTIASVAASAESVLFCKQIAGQIKGDDVTGAIPESLATAHDPAHHHKDIVGGVALTGDDVVAAEVDGATLKRRKCRLQSSIIDERFGRHRDIYSASNRAAPWSINS